MKGEQRIWSGDAADVQLGIPGCALVDAHAEPLAAQEVVQDLIGKPQVLRMRAARQVSLDSKKRKPCRPRRGHQDEGYAFARSRVRTFFPRGLSRRGDACF